MGSTSIMKVILAVVSLFHIFTLASSDCFRLKYTRGNAMVDGDCTGPNGEAYPTDLVNKLIPDLRRQHSRMGRNLLFGQSLSFTEDPLKVQEQLLRTHAMGGGHGIADMEHHIRTRREAKENKGNAASKKPSSNSTTTTTTTEKTTTTSTAKQDAASQQTCSETPARLCKSSFNTTAPMYGVSLTSGDPVTIVQKFPDLLQQVVFETCDSKECDLLHGECVQSYIPYLFLVIPLGPVTLTGQDYVLVESGCTCRPKYAKPGSDPNPTSIIPNFGA